MKYHNIIAFLFIVNLSIISHAANNSFEIKGNIYGTVYKIIIEKSNFKNKEKIINEINSILNRINAIASNYDENSELYRFNKNKSENFINVSKELYEIIEKSFYINQITNGYFDISLNTLKKEYGFYNLENTSKDQIDSQKNITITDLKDKIILHDTNLQIKKFSSNTELDLSGIAKGYAVDQLYETLKKYSASFLINIGGEIRVHGNIRWHIRIDDPSSKNNYSKIISLKNMSIASSGRYKNFIKKNNKEISHIFNPKTNKPKKKKNLIISVIHKDCSTADALATALSAMEESDIIEFANNNDIAVIYTNYEKNKIISKESELFKKYIKE
tara:strand:- start:2448 stop:3440 length:993 start_codon:yes stop_codon:yes gene_type:complete